MATLLAAALVAQFWGRANQGQRRGETPDIPPEVLPPEINDLPYRKKGAIALREDVLTEFGPDPDDVEIAISDIDNPSNVLFWDRDTARKPWLWTSRRPVTVPHPDGYVFQERSLFGGNFWVWQKQEFVGQDFPIEEEMAFGDLNAQPPDVTIQYSIWRFREDVEEPEITFTPPPGETEIYEIPEGEPGKSPEIAPPAPLEVPTLTPPAPSRRPPPGPPPVPNAEPLETPTAPPGPGTPPDLVPPSTPVRTPGPALTPTRRGTPVLPEPDPELALTPEGGTEVIPPPETPVVTPPTQRRIGGVDIGGPGLAPPPTMEGIAQEVGRLERKMEIALGGGPQDPDGEGPQLPSLEDILQLLLQLLEFLDRQQESVIYEVGSPCEFGEDGELLPPFRVPVPPESGFDAVTLRLDALAELIREHKNQRQPTCKGGVRLEGTEVTVRFVGLSPVTQRRTYKTFTYRDQGSVDLEAHRAHWAGFTFTNGPVMVSLNGPWGRPRVYASTAEEGRRVIRHAASIAGIDESHPDAEWVQVELQDGRIGNSFQVQTAELSFGVPWVTSRPGPSGLV